MKKFIKILFSTVLLIFSSLAYSQKEYDFDAEASKVIPKFLGEVILVKGNVIAKKKGSNRKVKLKLGTKVWPQDIVETNGRSFLKLLMVDDTYLTLGPKSSIDFRKFKFKSKTDRVMDVNLLRGKVRMHFRKKAKEGDIRVRVGEVSMGVRGTEIMGNSFMTKTGTKVSQVALLRGSVLAEFPNGKSKLLVPGDHSVTTIRNNGVMDNAVKIMTKSEVMKYLSLQQDSSKDFKPLLEFYDALDKLTMNTADRGQSESLEDSENSEELDSQWPAPRAKRQKWKSSLKNLNNRLHENNKD